MTLCAATVLCGLALHLGTDAVDVPTDLAQPLAPGLVAANEHTTQCDLLGEVALLALAIAIDLPLLIWSVSAPSPVQFSRVLPPPVRPPLVLR